MKLNWGWTVHGDGKRIEPGGVVAPEERLSWPRTIGIGMQHVIAMFGATLLVPTLTGFPVNTTLLFSGLGTIIFLLITRNSDGRGDHVRPSGRRGGHRCVAHCRRTHSESRR